MSKIDANIEEFGWHCVIVRPRIDDTDEDFVPFAYTVGFTATLNHPELVIFDLPDDASHGILSECFDLVREGGALPQNEPVQGVLANDLHVFLRPMRAEYLPEYVGVALRHYGARPFGVLVVFWPDSNNVFPWEPGSEASSQKRVLNVV